MFWKTGYCFSAKELFDNFNAKELGIKKKIVYDKYGCDCKQTFCGKVLIYVFMLILEDIIKNNITFKFPPIGEKECVLHVKAFTDDLFKKKYINGTFKDIDFLASNFTGYQIYLRYQTKTEIKEKPVYISKIWKDMFYDNINNGKTYY